MVVRYQCVVSGGAIWLDTIGRNGGALDDSPPCRTIYLDIIAP